MVSISEPGQSRPRALLGGTVLFLVIPWPFVVIRLWARRLKYVKFCFNDYMIIIAAILASGYNINWMFEIILGGLGQNPSEISPEENVEYAKIGFVATVIWPVANTAVRLSILHFYKKLLFTPWVTLACTVLALVNIAYCIAIFIAAFTICSPLDHQWEPDIGGRCGNKDAFWLSSAIINLVLDVLILILPQPVIWQLHTSLKKRLELTFVFGLGAGICAISIVRCWSFTQINPSAAQQTGVLLGICSCLEPTLGVINACLPMVPPAFAKFQSTRCYAWVKRRIPGRKGSLAKLIEQQKLGIPFGTPGPSPTRPRNSRWPYFARGRSEQIFVTNDVDVSAELENDEGEVKIVPQPFVP